MSTINTGSILLTHKKEISDIYSKFGNNDSAHSFQSIYMWKDDMELEVALSNDFYAVKDKRKQNPTWFFPVGSREKKLEFIGSLIDEKDLAFSYMTKRDKEFLEENFPGAFDIVLKDSHSEYIISRETLSELQGGGFSKTRGYIKRLKKEHEMEVLSLDFLPLEGVLEIIRIWDHNREEYISILDKHASVNALKDMKELELSGVVLLMDGTPCAVAAGFKLDDETVDCCIEKTTTGIQGLTFYLRSEFVKSFPQKVKFFNWEEDLGLDGLRQAKRHMHPRDMIEMYKGRKK